MTLVGVVQFSPCRTKGAHALGTALSRWALHLSDTPRFSLPPAPKFPYCNLSINSNVIPTCKWQIVFPIYSSISDFWIFIMPFGLLFGVNSSIAFLVQCLLMLSHLQFFLILSLSTLLSTTGKNLNWKAALFFMSCPSWETTCEIKIPKDSLFLVADVFWTSDHSSCPHLPGDTALHIFPFKTSEIILVMEKSTISAGFGWVFGSTGMSAFHTCVNVLCAKRWSSLIVYIAA